MFDAEIQNTAITQITETPVARAAVTTIAPNYVIRPQGDWTLRMLANTSGVRTRTKGNGRKEFFTTDVKADMNTKWRTRLIFGERL